jgi:hypothetical protein
VTPRLPPPTFEVLNGEFLARASSVNLFLDPGKKG